MIACVNLITDYKQHVVVQYLVSPASQPVSRMSILWLHLYVNRLAFTNIVYYDFVVFLLLANYAAAMRGTAWYKYKLHKQCTGYMVSK